MATNTLEYPSLGRRKINTLSYGLELLLTPAGPTGGRED
jgi:hypothetical protein